MRVLLAGGAGFIGYHLTRRLLERNHEVLTVDNFSSGRWSNVRGIRSDFPAGPFAVLRGDVCGLRLQDQRLDAVIHLASLASPPDYLRHPIETLEAGSVGTRSLLEIARRSGARFLLASTSEVYGDPHVHPQPESYWGHVNPVGPRSVYDEAKRFSEALCSAYARAHGLTVRIARIFNTYGPRMRLGDGRVIPTFVSQAIRGEPLTVHGDGSQTRSYCYVDDLVEGLLELLGSEVQGPVNLGNPEEYTVLETARVVLDLVGSRSRIVHVHLPEDDPRQRRPDIARARRELGWEPRTPFREGLERTIADLARRVRVDGSAARTRVPREKSGVASGTSPAAALAGRTSLVGERNAGLPVV